MTAASLALLWLAISSASGHPGDSARVSTSQERLDLRASAAALPDLRSLVVSHRGQVIGEYRRRLFDVIEQEVLRRLEPSEIP